jgi:hypothetical protein
VSGILVEDVWNQCQQMSQQATLTHTGAQFPHLFNGRHESKVGRGRGGGEVPAVFAGARGWLTFSSPDGENGDAILFSSSVQYL